MLNLGRSYNPAQYRSLADNMSALSQSTPDIGAVEDKESQWEKIALKLREGHERIAQEKSVQDRQIAQLTKTVKQLKKQIAPKKSSNERNHVARDHKKDDTHERFSELVKQGVQTALSTINLTDEQKADAKLNQELAELRVKYDKVSLEKNFFEARAKHNIANFQVLKQKQATHKAVVQEKNDHIAELSAENALLKSQMKEMESFKPTILDATQFIFVQSVANCANGVEKCITGTLDAATKVIEYAADNYKGVTVEIAATALFAVGLYYAGASFSIHDVGTNPVTTLAISDVAYKASAIQKIWEFIF